MRITIFIAALLVFGTTCAAQTPRPTPKTIVTIEMPTAIYHQMGQAQLTYFPESDETEVRLELKPYRSQEESIGISLVCSGKGKKIEAPETIYTKLLFLTDKAKAQNVSSFLFDADGELVNLNDMSKGEVGATKHDQKWYSYLRGKLPFAMFERLVNAKSLKVRVADLVIEMDEQSRDGLRDMLKAIKNPKPSPND